MSRDMMLTVDEYLALRRLIDSEHEHQGEKDSRKTSKPKPKRKSTAWTRFVKAEMPKMRRKYPRSKPPQLMKKVAQKWKTSTKNPNRKRRRR